LDIDNHGEYLSVLIIVIVYIFSIRNSFATGFDFTDGTLNYHFALEILNGNIPFKDFSLTVLPLSFYLESAIHFIFGENYIYNLYLGIIITILGYYAVFKILLIYYNKKLSLIFTLVLLITFEAGTFPYFSFTPLSITASIWVLYFTIRYIINDRPYYLSLAGMITSVVFFSKQSYGVFLILFIGSVWVFKKYLNVEIGRKFQIKYFLFGFIIIALPILIYFYQQNIIIDVIDVFSESGSKKGIYNYSIKGLILSIVGITNPKHLIGIILFIPLVFGMTRSKRRLNLLSFSIFLGILSVFIIARTYQIGNLVRWQTYIEFPFYDVPRLIAFIILIVAFFTRVQINSGIILSSIFLLLISTSAQLGWPGRHYVRIMTTSYFFFLIPPAIGSIKQTLLNKADEREQEKSKHNTMYYKYLILLVLLYISIDYFNPYWQTRRDFKDKIVKYTQKPYLIKYKMSLQHADAIKSLRHIFNENCSRDNSLFIFPWAPILYNLLGAKNPTIYDLPYHDWITLKDGKQIIHQLNKTLPCMMIIEENLESPFPAKGMFYVQDKINDILANYDYINTVVTFGKVLNIYSIKQNY